MTLSNGRLAESALRTLESLKELGWTYNYDNAIVTLQKGANTIQADGVWKDVRVERTVLQQSVKSLEEMLETIRMFAHAVDAGLLEVAKRWTDVIGRLETTPWSMTLLENRAALEQLERIAHEINQ